jgi:uncharacterized C2H2 Zn-finger protein
MEREVKCLRCDHLIFKQELLDDGKGNMAWDVSTIPDPSVDEDGDKFYACPCCSAKNVLVHRRNLDGILRATISHIKE